jgi:hypothetical protein
VKSSQLERRRGTTLGQAPPQGCGVGSEFHCRSKGLCLKIPCYHMNPVLAAFNSHSYVLSISHRNQLEPYTRFSAIPYMARSRSRQSSTSNSVVLNVVSYPWKHTTSRHLSNIFKCQSLTCSFGSRISTVRDAILREIVHVEEALTRYRSHIHNLQDYIPLLRWIPWSNGGVESYRIRRDIYMKELIDRALDRRSPMEMMHRARSGEYGKTIASSSMKVADWTSITVCA